MMTKKLIFTIFFIFAFISESFATREVWISGVYSALPTTTTEYSTPLGTQPSWITGTNDAWQATEFTVENIVPTAGTISDLRVNLTTAPGASKSYAFTVRKNSVDTALTLTISGTDTSGSDVSNSFTVVAGDAISLECTPVGTPTASYATWSMRFNSDTATNTVLMGGSGGGVSITLTEYFTINARDYVGDSTQGNVDMVMPVAGTIRDLYVELSGTPGAGNNYAFTLMKNGSAQTLTTTISDSATSNSDTSNTVAVVAGDVINLREVPTSSPTQRAFNFGVVFQPTNTGDFVAGANAEEVLGDNTQETFTDINMAEENNVTIESQAQQLAQNMVIKSLYVDLNTAPGAAKSWVITLRKNGVDTELSVTLSGASALAGSDTGWVQVNDGDLLNYEVTPSGTPAATSGSISIGGFIRRRIL